MGKNKLQKFKELNNIKNTIQPDKKVLLNNQFALRGEWHKEFGNKNPIILELGCGKGEYTVQLAQKFPENNYIGIDIKGSRIWTGAKFSSQNKLDNVRFLRTQIEFLDFCFSENEITEIWITFPDPQIKYRRRKKRLTGISMLNRYKKVLKKKGFIHLKTDSQFLHGFTLGIIEEGGHVLEDSTHDLYNSGDQRSNLEITTYYENLFLKKEKAITYLRFQLQP